MLVGSCFSDHIGKKFSDAYFRVCSNPGGNYFSPASIGAFLKSSLNLDPPHQNMFVKRDGLWASLEMQNIRASQVEELMTQIVKERLSNHQWLHSSNTLIITFGTAVAYNYKTLGWVANNHKQPNQDFVKKLWTLNQCIDFLEPIIDELLLKNKALNIIFTVSPVKYLKGGLEQNSISKSVLVLLANHLGNKTRCGYFPAYELVTDDLRDYRFYAEDLAHPNQLAVNYVWEKLVTAYFAEHTQLVLPLLEQCKKAISHLPNFTAESMPSEPLKRLEERIKHYLPHFTLPSLPEKP